MNRTVSASAAFSALAAADVADFFFAASLAGRAMELGRSGRAIMRPERGASYRVCFASTPIATALTLLSFSPAFTSFVGHSRARGQSELGLQVDPPAPPLRRADRGARGSLRLPPTSPIS